MVFERLCCNVKKKPVSSGIRIFFVFRRWEKPNLTDEIPLAISREYQLIESTKFY